VFHDAQQCSFLLAQFASLAIRKVINFEQTGVLWLLILLL
jgi:hypothetical protein